MTKVQVNRIKRWIKALRSGDFKQGKWHLKNKYGKYCCMGVAIEIFKKQLGYIFTDQANYNRPTKLEIVNHSASFPPKGFLVFIGLTEDQICELVLDNDKGKSFDVIADKLEGILSTSPIYQTGRSAIKKSTDT